MVQATPGSVSGQKVALVLLELQKGARKKGGKNPLGKFTQLTGKPLSPKNFARAAVSGQGLVALGRELDEAVPDQGQMAAVVAQLLDYGKDLFPQDRDFKPVRAALSHPEGADVATVIDCLSQRAKDLGLSFVKVGNSWITSSPITVGQYRAFVEQTGHREPEVAGYKTWANLPDEAPITGVTVKDAKAFCAWLGYKFKLPAQETIRDGVGRGLVQAGNIEGKTFYELTGKTAKGKAIIYHPQSKETRAASGEGRFLNVGFRLELAGEA